ncbi:MAG: bifunctional DNA-formamidopyrimidine glycosylase/DNA-(apurinic or apyrimidinic site) lyase [Luteolibacter sp.]
MRAITFVEMPELPEVETTRLGVLPHVKEKTIRELIVRRRDLRQPVTRAISAIEGKTILGVKRRSKYLLFELNGAGHLLVHLGMSGSLRVTKPADEWRKHDHVGITVSKSKQLRFHDPRRFGLVLWIQGDPMEHPLLKRLGPEPLSDDFSADTLKAACAKRSAAIKLVIMDAKVVVGVGNIYASESLFRAGISPRIAAKRLSKPKLAKLVEVIRKVLTESIEEGGTTLRDFVNSEGNPGYFKQRLFVYGREGEPCRMCKAPIKQAVMGQRATYWCSACQR